MLTNNEFIIVPFLVGSIVNKHHFNLLIYVVAAFFCVVFAYTYIWNWLCYISLTLTFSITLSRSNLLSMIIYRRNNGPNTNNKGQHFSPVALFICFFFLHGFRLYFYCCVSDSRSLLTNLLHTLYSHNHSAYYHNVRSSNAMHIAIIMSNKSKFMHFFALNHLFFSCG